MAQRSVWCQGSIFGFVRIALGLGTSLSQVGHENCVMASSKEAEALRSAAYLIAALADRRFGARSLSDELRDCIGILTRELDGLGLLADYRRPDGTLAAWDEKVEAYGQEVLERAPRTKDASKTNADSEAESDE